MLSNESPEYCLEPIYRDNIWCETCPCKTNLTLPCFLHSEKERIEVEEWPLISLPLWSQFLQLGSKQLRATTAGSIIATHSKLSEKP